MRDFFVTQLSDSVVVRFKYEPAYMDSVTTAAIDTSTREYLSSLNVTVTELDLVLDGGSIVWEPSSRRAVLTERVLRDNPWLVGKASLSYGGAPPGQQNVNRYLSRPLPRAVHQRQRQLPPARPPSRTYSVSRWAARAWRSPSCQRSLARRVWATSTASATFIARRCGALQLFGCRPVLKLFSQARRSVWSRADDRALSVCAHRRRLGRRL